MEHSAEYQMFSLDLELCKDAELQLQIAEDIDLLESAISALQ